MNTKKARHLLFSFLSLAALFLFVACPTTDERGHVLNVEISKDHDSLLTFDSLIIKVYSKDSAFTQVVFHGILRDRKQVLGLPLDERVGKEYKVSIVGYKGGKMELNKEVTILGGNNFQSKDLPVPTEKDTIKIDPVIPEILAPTDTSVAEGDSLRIRISVRNPWSGVTSLTLKDAIPGAALDTAGRDLGDGYFTWRPNFDQGRTEPFAVTFVYASSDKKVEKITRVKVLNINRPPKLVAIADQKAKENETLSFKVEGVDPDHDSLSLTASSLPDGSVFSSGSFTWKPKVGQAGNYSVKFRAFDGGDSDLVAVLITVGNVDVPPALTVEITSPARDTTINFTPITVQYTVNGTLLQKKFPLKDGKNRIRIDTTVQSRTAFDTVLIILDTVPPGKPIVTGASPVRTRTPAWSWSSGGDGSGIYRYHLDVEDMSTSIQVTEPGYTASKDQDPGTHTLFVQERDAAGNWSQTGKFSIRIDTTRPAPPTVAVEAVPTRNVLPTWTWQSVGDDVIGIYRYKLDNADFRSGAVETKATSYTPDNANALKEGPHALFVQQQDSAGNWSNSGSATVRVDLTPPDAPQIKLAQPSPTNLTKPAWSWTSGGNGGIGIYRLKLDDSVLTVGAITAAIFSLTPDTNLSHGVHTLFVQERDSAGNWSAVQSRSVVVDLVPPSPPVFDVTSPTPINSLQPTWTWKSGGGGGASIYRVRMNDTNWISGADTVRVGSFAPSKSLGEGAHLLYVQERDSAGNWSNAVNRKLVSILRGPLGTAGFSNGTASATSLTLNKAGQPYIVYREDSNLNLVVVMRYNGSAWVQVGYTGFWSGDYPALALDSAGVPYVAFSDDANSGRLTVKRFTGSLWESVGVAGFSKGYAGFIRLAFSSRGVPYVGFEDGGDSYKARVMRLNGSDWESVGGGISDGTANQCSFALSGNDIPYIAFIDVPNGFKGKLMRLNGSAWESVGGGAFSDGELNFISLAFSGTTPYIAYQDYANDYKVSVKRFAGGSWEYVGKPGFTPGKLGPLWTSLVMDGTGTPYLAFKDAANAGSASVVRFNGSAWTYMGTTGLSTGEADNISLGVDGLGIPYVAFKDGASGDKATVVRTSFDP